MTKCFLTTPTNLAALYLRRYVFGSGDQCSGPMSYHNNMTLIGEVSITIDDRGCWSEATRESVPHDDPRWPTHCTCGHPFDEKDEWQHFHERLYTDGTRTWPQRDLPVGAMFYADWYPKNMFWDNKEDDHLHIITPGGTWNIDSRASNCTLPNDRLHRCWVRHGQPPEMVHVDKAGRTCAAGAGSIMCGNYHGFLHHGHLT